MKIHQGVIIDVLDEALSSVGAEQTELATCGAVGLILFDSPEEMEWYEGRVLKEAKDIRRKRRTPEEVEAIRARNKANARNAGRPKKEKLAE